MIGEFLVFLDFLFLLLLCYVDSPVARSRYLLEVSKEIVLPFPSLNIFDVITSASAESVTQSTEELLDPVFFRKCVEGGSDIVGILSLDGVKTKILNIEFLVFVELLSVEVSANIFGEVGASAEPELFKDDHFVVLVLDVSHLGADGVEDSGHLHLFLPHLPLSHLVLVTFSGLCCKLSFLSSLFAFSLSSPPGVEELLLFGLLSFLSLIFLAPLQVSFILFLCVHAHGGGLSWDFREFASPAFGGFIDLHHVHEFSHLGHVWHAA